MRLWSEMTFGNRNPRAEHGTLFFSGDTCDFCRVLLSFLTSGLSFRQNSLFVFRSDGLPLLRELVMCRITPLAEILAHVGPLPCTYDSLALRSALTYTHLLSFGSRNLSCFLLFLNAESFSFICSCDLLGFKTFLDLRVEVNLIHKNPHGKMKTDPIFGVCVHVCMVVYTWRMCV